MGYFNVYALVTVSIIAVVGVIVIRDGKWYLIAAVYLYIWGSAFFLHWHYVANAGKYFSSMALLDINETNQKGKEYFVLNVACTLLTKVVSSTSI
jgi:hypothetical protein